MSIVEKAGEISENNTTIAKNQQRVYDAGVRAGLAQDPDYAEGYEDGHAQGISDASGVIWEDLLSGEIAVGRAREADHADEATHAVNADNALRADRATEADHASKATNADYSTNANRASEADHSDTATNATHADRATNADNADRADFAGHATSANNATLASTADVAKSIEGVLPLESGGTGASTVEGALATLGLTGFAKIATGTYVGTGTFGSANPTSIELPFVPKFVYVKLVKYYYYSLSPTMGKRERTEYAEQGTDNDGFIWLDGMERIRYSGGSGERYYSYYMVFSPTESGLSWYVRDPDNFTLSDTSQLNGRSYEEYNKEGKLTHKEEYTYAYIAIG